MIRTVILIFSRVLKCNMFLLFQMEHLKACAEIATQRTINWQKFCMKDDCKFFQIRFDTGNKEMFKTSNVNIVFLFSLFLSVTLLVFLQLFCTSCSRSASLWMREFPQYFCNCSHVPCVAVRWWPTPPLHHSLEAPVVLDRQEGLSPLRASPPVKRAKKKTRRKTKRVIAHTTCCLLRCYTLKAEAQVSLWTWTGYLQNRTIDASVLTVLYLCGLTTGDGVGSQEDQLCMGLVSQLNKFADKETLIQFLRCFLLESNSSAVRWQAHCLALHIYRYCQNTWPCWMICLKFWLV